MFHISQNKKIVVEYRQVQSLFVIFQVLVVSCTSVDSRINYKLSRMSSSKKTDQFFKPISADDEANETTEVESYCVNCGENGTTKLLLAKIPFYKEVILSSFSCPHCHYSNNEIQSAGDILDHGIEWNLRVEESVDINRQVIKSDYASISIPELDLEIPGKTQKGEITTLEGILDRVYNGLDQDQARRKEEHPEDYEKIQKFLERIRDAQALTIPFSLKLRDISGQSFISPPPSILPGHKDPRLQMTQFERTSEENHSVGYFPEMTQNETSCEGGGDDDGAGAVAGESVGDLTDEVHQFHTPCNSCGRSSTTRMKLTKIPHFKEVVIMATDCENCGYRTNEVKSGSAIEAKGRRIGLKVTGVDDLCRDVLKSETASLEIPELDFEVGGGILGGKFTTLEGLLCSMKERLQEENPLISGDSAGPEMQKKMDEFCQKLDQLISAQVPFTVILDDPAGNSYLQNIYAPDDDPNMEVVDYERTFEQNEELGLNDINTEEYAAPQPTGDSAEKAQSSEPCLPCGEKNAGSGDDK
ncbi:zinc finger protein ZPR1 isoform X1 [Folsomia candida]|uniref:zinc finger protein ZPR1 isoform X1 n=1 Tax=Folsomia candida TaxID=158441 RepID=UPI00160508BF|nr:zinc finger protein ZPR1 isoform X1 [Folsomia candida]